MVCVVVAIGAVLLRRSEQATNEKTLSESIT